LMSSSDQLVAFCGETKRKLADMSILLSSDMSKNPL